MNQDDFDKMIDGYFERKFKPKPKPKKAEFPWFGLFVVVSVVMMIAIALHK